MAEWTRVLKSTHEQFVKGVANETTEERVLLSMLKKRGRMKFNQFGNVLDWRVKYKKRSLDAYSDMSPVVFKRQNLYQKAVLDWRGYMMQDAISKKERLMNRGNAAIFQLYSGMVEDMKEDFMELFSAELYVDGNATGYTDRFHGLESIFGYTACGSSGVQYVTSNETYAGLTAAGVYGTASDYSYWSPVLINENYTGYGSWATGAIKICRALLTACSKGNTKKARPDVVLTTEARYHQFLALLQAEERIIASNKELTEAGFEAVELDGRPITYDGDCPAGVTYCLNLDQIELRFLGADIVDGETGYDVTRKAFLFSLDSFGNMRINPRYQGKAKNFES